MNDEEFLKKLREAFSIEADEHVQAITAGLLELEKSPPAPRRREIVETIFREAHSLKGAARAVNRTDIESVCQGVEGVFSQWKQNADRVTSANFDLLNRAMDLVTRLMRLPDVATGGAERAEIADMARDLGSVPSAPPPEAPPAVPPTHAPEPHAGHEITSLQIAETVRIPMAKMDALLRQEIGRAHV